MYTADYRTTFITKNTVKDPSDITNTKRIIYTGFKSVKIIIKKKLTVFDKFLFEKRIMFVFNLWFKNSFLGAILKLGAEK